MRFSVLTLLIVLPAAAYAAVCPQQLSTGSGMSCGERGDWCNDQMPCCGRLECMWNGFANVCTNAHSLSLMLNMEPNAGMWVKGWGLNIEHLGRKGHTGRCKYG
jgi:hypothetical protein